MNLAVLSQLQFTVMIKLFIYLIVPILISINVFAQIEPGARQISLSHSDVALSNDVFSLFNNPSGLSQIHWREVGVYYSPSPFGLSELSNGYIAYNEPFDFGSMAIGGMTYGFELYRESRFVIGYSYNYNDKFFVGLAFNFHSFSIQNYGNTSALYFNFGGLAYITDQFRWGFSISNLNRASIGEEDDQIPMIFSTGFSYNLISPISLNLSIIKDIRYKPSVRFGIEYNIIRYLSLRTGFQNEPSQYSAGIGVNYSIVKFDYALFTHQDLGLTHQVSIIISFGRENPQTEGLRNQ